MKRRLTGIILIAAVGVAGVFLIWFGYRTYLKMAYPMRYQEYITRYAEEYQVNPLLIRAVIRTESSFYERAVSSENARGLMQLKPETFEWAMTKVKIEQSYTQEDLFDPEINIRFGTVTLKTLIDEFEDTDIALCAYHAGWGNVKSWLNNPKYSDDGKMLNEIPVDSTRSYVGKVREAMETYQRIYGSSILEHPLYH